MTKGIRYYTVGEVQDMPWIIQGSYYPKLEDAKYAALKLYCITTGVIVKRSSLGFALFFWRRNTLAA